jgi:hypothetical protein
MIIVINRLKCLAVSACTNAQPLNPNTYLNWLVICIRPKGLKPLGRITERYFIGYNLAN